MSNVLDGIYNFYPPKCRYSGEQYQTSKEYKKYLEVTTNSLQRKKVDKMVYGIVESVFDGYYIKKWTNTEQPSIHYSVLLHKNQPILDDDVELLEALNGKRMDLEIYVSLLTKSYYLYGLETRKQGELWEFDVFDFSLIIEKEKMNNLVQMFSEKGYSKLSKECVNENVPLIETELHEEGEAKVFQCLFSELERIF
ncbi:MAG: hypothetical protein IJA27_00865 [Lachnospiraceae bacterium]|nr:hypothetical protein [Lachnospiraceae bacterium]